MSPETLVLPETQQDFWQRLDAAEILKRFFYIERALLVASAGWIPCMHRIETKANLARAVWQHSLTADALRERVFELRYPSRRLEEGANAPLIRLYRAAQNAPGPMAFLLALRELLPPLRAAYLEYLRSSDATADGPSIRFLELAVRDNEEQQARVAQALVEEPQFAGPDAERAQRWLGELSGTLKRLGQVQLVPPETAAAVAEVLPHGKPFGLAQRPARDDRYFACTYYWPDVVDPNFPYGEGAALQLRSAVSHLNEVWAVETAGAIIDGLANELGWDFILDASRWLFDESRHMLMGKERLDRWGFDPARVPLGDYIYLACRDQDAIYRIGMLGHFETKNIGKKRDRAEAFAGMGDLTSERHMEFDWADETIHAEYGRRWLKRLLENRDQHKDEYPQVLERCQELVQQQVRKARPDEKEAITALAHELIREAEARAGSRPDDVHT